MGLALLLKLENCRRLQQSNAGAERLHRNSHERSPLQGGLLPLHALLPTGVCPLLLPWKAQSAACAVY